MVVVTINLRWNLKRFRWNLKRSRWGLQNDVDEANLINWVCAICTQYGACTNFVLYILNGEYVQISVRYKYASSTNLINLAYTVYTRCWVCISVVRYVLNGEQVQLVVWYKSVSRIIVYNLLSYLWSKSYSDDYMNLSTRCFTTLLVCNNRSTSTVLDC